MFEGTKQLHKAVSLISFAAGIFTFSLIAGCGSTSDSNEAVRNTSLNTYVDPISSLEWIAFWDTDYINEFTHDEIYSFCERLDANGKSDWRMPSADETLDYLMHNTEIHEIDSNYISAVSTHFTFFSNPLVPPDDKETYYSNSNHNIVFKAVPLIREYDYDDRQYFGSVRILFDNPDDPYDTPEPNRVSSVTEESALEIIMELGINEFWESEVSEFSCVRGTHNLNSLPLGTWVNVENQVEIKSTGQFAYSVTPVDDRHIRLSKVMYKDSHSAPDGTYIPADFIIDHNAHYISSGIPDVRVKGQIKSFAEAASVQGIAGIDVILGCLTNKEPQYCQELIIKPATPDNPHNTYEEATEDGESNILYVIQDADGNYILDNDNPVTIASGKITISLTDSAGNTAIFTVEISGEDTDVGVLNIPDLQTLYNFKTSIAHGTDYIYHGYNEGDSPLTYSKLLSICNVGSASISGTTFSIEVDPDNASVVRSFSHTYDGSPVGFAADSCVDYTVDFEFYRPAEDTEVKFNIEIKDNFNGLTWHDYTAFKLSQHPPVNVYLASNTQQLEGFLVAPGNQLVRIEFSPNQYSQNFLRVPSYRDSEYHVVLYTSSIDGEDTYMITTTDPPDISKMDGFSNVYAYEPNDDLTNATIVPLHFGEAVSYLHSGDMDFFTLKDSPAVTHQIANLFIDENIVIPFNTNLDPQSVINNVSITQQGADITGSLTYMDSSHVIVFDPYMELSAGTINITLSGDISSNSGIPVGADMNWPVNVVEYPPVMTTVSKLPVNYFPSLIGLLDDGLIINKTITYTEDNGSIGQYNNALFDISSKHSPLLIGESPITRDLIYRDGYCFTRGYTSTGSSRPTIYDCQSARNILQLTSYPASITNVGMLGYTIKNNRMYVTYYYSATKHMFDILDITDPLDPVILGSLNSDNAGTSLSWGTNLIATDDRLYVSSIWGFHVFDISNDSSPTLLKEIDHPDYFEVVEIAPDGITLYTLNNIGKLIIVDFSDPDNPVYNENISGLPEGITTLLVSGTKLYTTTRQHYMHIFDISIPSNPTLIDSYQYSSSTYSIGDGLMIKDRFAYIDDYVDREIEIVNIQMYQ